VPVQEKRDLFEDFPEKQGVLGSFPPLDINAWQHNFGGPRCGTNTSLLRVNSNVLLAGNTFHD
jgi:hypothetical protein